MKSSLLSRLSARFKIRALFVAPQFVPFHEPSYACEVLEVEARREPRATHALRLARWLAILAALLGLALPAPAATVFVTVTNYSFTPKVIQINAGDTIIWTNRAPSTTSHTVTGTKSTPPPTDTICGFGNLPSYCSHEFDIPGSYNYVCTYHEGSPMFMTGEVMVLNISPPPAQPVLTNLSLSGGLLQFTANVTANHTNLVQATTNVPANWITIGSNATANSSFNFTDNAGLFPIRFYRVIAQ